MPFPSPLTSLHYGKTSNWFSQLLPQLLLVCSKPRSQNTVFNMERCHCSECNRAIPITMRTVEPKSLLPSKPCTVWFPLPLQPHSLILCFWVTPVTVVSLNALGMPFSQSFSLADLSAWNSPPSDIGVIPISACSGSWCHFLFKKKKKLFFRPPCVLSGGRRDLLVTISRLFQLRHAGDLVSRPGIKPGLAALGMRSLNPWATKEVPHMPLSP